MASARGAFSASTRFSANEAVSIPEPAPNLLTTADFALAAEAAVPPAVVVLLVEALLVADPVAEVTEVTRGRIQY